MEKCNEPDEKPVKYYGKKTYCVHPHLVCQKTKIENKETKCWYEDIEIKLNS